MSLKAILNGIAEGINGAGQVGGAAGARTSPAQFSNPRATSADMQELVAKSATKADEQHPMWRALQQIKEPVNGAQKWGLTVKAPAGTVTAETFENEFMRAGLRQAGVYQPTSGEISYLRGQLKRMTGSDFGVTPGREQLAAWSKTGEITVTLNDRGLAVMAVCAEELQRGRAASGAREAAIQKIFDDTKNNNELAKFVSGSYGGARSGIASTVQVVSHPIDSLEALGGALYNWRETVPKLQAALGDKYQEFVAADSIRKAEMLGHLNGEVVLGIVGTKGAGTVLRGATGAARATQVGMAAEEAVNASRVVVAGKHAIATGKTAAEQYGKSALVRAAVVLERAVKEDATIKVLLKEVGRGEIGAAWMRAGVVVAERLEQPMRASDFIRTQMAERGRTVELGITRGASAPPLTATARTAMREGRTAYFRAYDEAVIAGKSSVEANRAGRTALQQTLGKQGVAVDELAFDHIERAVTRLERAANTSSKIEPISVDEVKRRVAMNASPGEFVVRVTKRAYLGDGMSAVDTRSPKGWWTSMDEVEGLRLNQRAMLDAVGFPEGMVKDAQAGEYVMLVYRSKDLGEAIVPTKESIINLARQHSDFMGVSSKPAKFWQDVVEYPQYKTRLKEFQDLQKLDPELKVADFARTLPAAEQEKFRVRNQLHQTFGVNENFGGKGILVAPSGKETQREFLFDAQRFIDTPPHAIIDLR